MTDQELLDKVQKESDELTDQFCRMVEGQTLVVVIQASMNVIATAISAADQTFALNTAQMIRRFADHIEKTGGIPTTLN